MSGAVTENGTVMLWAIDPFIETVPSEDSTITTPILHARAGRWHGPPHEHAEAFAMITHEGLGANASRYGRMLPAEVIAVMFYNMYFRPHAGTPHGLHNMMGRQLPRRVVALDHDAVVLPGDLDEE
jgi:hypothetical protein